MSIRVVTDSTTDLPQGVAQQYGITVIPCYLNIGRQSYLDGLDITREEFYRQMPLMSSPPTTSAPGTGKFVEVYEELFRGGADGVFSIHVSPHLSNLSNVASMAAEAVQIGPVQVADSGNLTLGTGYMAVKAAQAAADGASMADLVHLVENLRVRTYCFAVLNTLEYLQRSGRVSRLQASLGAWFKVYPLIRMWNGEIKLDKIRLHSKAVARVIELVEHLGDLEELAIVHSHAPDKAQQLFQSAKSLFPTGKPVWITEVTPVIGAHIGPGAVGFVAVSQQSKRIE